MTKENLTQLKEQASKLEDQLKEKENTISKRVEHILNENRELSLDRWKSREIIKALNEIDVKIYNIMYKDD